MNEQERCPSCDELAEVVSDASGRRYFRHTATKIHGPFPPKTVPVPREIAEPPSGPPGSVPHRRSGSRAAYLDWRATEEGQQVWRSIKDRAADALRHDEERIGTKGLVEATRALLKVPINNSYTGWLADDLIREYPGLEKLIERRVRKKDAA